jgi:hypothetical protein
VSLVRLFFCEKIIKLTCAGLLIIGYVEAREVADIIFWKMAEEAIFLRSLL